MLDLFKLSIMVSHSQNLLHSCDTCQNQDIFDELRGLDTRGPILQQKICEGLVGTER